MVLTPLLLLAAVGFVQTTSSNAPKTEGPPTQTSITEQLRASVIASANAYPGEQHVRFGPMKDGRELSITLQMVNESSKIQIGKVGGNTFVVLAGRKPYIVSVYLIDAMIICSHSPKACDRMEAYIQRVMESPSPAKAPFLEEAFPDLTSVAQSARADKALYWASLAAGIESLAGMLEFHEIGHAALHHLENPSKDPAVQIAREGEADGFCGVCSRTRWH